MIRGSCFCGGVRFEFPRAIGPFELCHCSRCRKASGSAFFAWLLVKREDFKLVQGQEQIKTFEAPVLEAPPAYCTNFCRSCGSPVPNPLKELPYVEVPAGLLDDDPLIRPDRHIFVDVKSPWFTISDELPRLDRAELRRFRSAQLQQARGPIATERE
jgi:hypothetical protein